MTAHLAPRPAFSVVTILALLLSLLATLTVTQPAAAAPTELFAEMDGTQEVPGPGDPDGFGFASLGVDPVAGEVCGFVEVVDIAAASAAHIHVGAAGVAGAIVVTLPTPDADGIADGCVDGLDPVLLQAIVDNPTGYYVNVHTADFPDGAVRGQLQNAPITLFYALDGASEVPGPGDPDGSGQGVLDFFLESGEICGFMEVAGIDAATAAHIHAGAEGVAGAVVVTLPTPDADGVAEGCLDGLDPGLLQAIVDDPADYYVNVHNAEFPEGALRGQLSSEPPPPPTCQPGQLCEGLLPPGTYTYTGFETPLSFTTVIEWFFFQDDIPSMNLFPPEEAAGLFGFPFVGQVFADPCDFDSVTTIGDSPAELMAWLIDRPFLTATDPIAVEYGGATGLQIDIVASLPPECTDPPWVLVWSLPIVGDFHFDEGSVARIVALDVAGETILFVAESLPGGDSATFLANAQAVLDSFQWNFALPGVETPSGTPEPSPAALPDTGIADPGTTFNSPQAGLALVLLSIGWYGLTVVRRRPSVE